MSEGYLRLSDQVKMLNIIFSNPSKTDLLIPIIERNDEAGGVACDVDTGEWR